MIQTEHFFPINQSIKRASVYDVTSLPYNFAKISLTIVLRKNWKNKISKLYSLPSGFSVCSKCFSSLIMRYFRNYGLLSALLSLISTVCTSPVVSEEEISTFIYGGVPAVPGEFPWIVSVQAANDHVCGGTLIDRDGLYVITAAHCVEFFETVHLSVLAGASSLEKNESTQQRRIVSYKIIHHAYNASVSRNDIALLLLSQPFILNQYVSYVLVPPSGFVSSGNCILAGWGVTETGEMADQLMKAVAPIVDKSTCFSSYPTMFDPTSQICVGLEEGGVGTCIGDTGGPLICQNAGQYYFAGVDSWGDGCGQPGKPNVYQEISHYLEWIVNPSDDAELPPLRCSYQP